MEEKMVFKIPKETYVKSIETMKVRKETLEYLRQHNFKTIEDIIDRYQEIPSPFRGNIYAFLFFGIED